MSVTLPPNVAAHVLLRPGRIGTRRRPPRTGATGDRNSVCAVLAPLLRTPQSFVTVTARPREGAVSSGLRSGRAVAGPRGPQVPETHVSRRPALAGPLGAGAPPDGGCCHGAQTWTAFGVRTGSRTGVPFRGARTRGDGAVMAPEEDEATHSREGVALLKGAAEGGVTGRSPGARTRPPPGGSSGRTQPRGDEKGAALGGRCHLPAAPRRGRSVRAGLGDKQAGAGPDRRPAVSRGCACGGPRAGGPAGRESGPGVREGVTARGADAGRGFLVASARRGAYSAATWWHRSG